MSMPEGDTIMRTAVTLDRWLRGREVTGARTTVEGLPAAKLVGQRVDAVEARGKHLLVRFSRGQVLHTHMRMTGAWHVYPAGGRWRRPEWQARLVLEAGERVAVCFNAPVVELLAPRAETIHPSLTGLGPDVLDTNFDPVEVVRRAAATRPDLPIGELLLDQRVVAGIGNIWRCESLFVSRIDPRTPRGDVSDGQLMDLLRAASAMMRRSAAPAAYLGRNFGGGADVPWVYGRAGRPCRVCRSQIVSERMGSQARTLFWCPRCQVRP